MEHIRIFRSVIGSPRSPRPSTEAEYDSDEMIAKGAMNYSKLCILQASQLVEPDGWYLGREYYVVTRGSAVGIFHRLSVSMPLFPFNLYLFGLIGRMSVALSNRLNPPSGKPARRGSRLSKFGHWLFRTRLSFWSVRKFGINLLQHVVY